MKDVLVFGGYGVFGSHVCRELAGLGVRVIVAGRDHGSALRLSEALGPRHRALRADLADPSTYRSELARQPVVVNCAGPFGGMKLTLLEQCLEADCHHVDISDDRGYTRLVRSHGDRLARKDLCAVFGCSSLPALSGALALAAASHLRAPVAAARVTLFIGNRNPKGLAAVRSVVAKLGKAIEAPQGMIYGFRDGVRVALPDPFGHREVFNVESPDYDLLPELLDLKSLVVKVGFELRLATRLFAVLAACSSHWGSASGRVLQKLGRLVSRSGSSGGVVMVELFDVHNVAQRAALIATHNGQRMAALPCVLAAHALSAGSVSGRGALTAYELLGAQTMLERIRGEGCTLLLG